MSSYDPIKQLDKLAREAQEYTKKHTGPIRRRYPFFLALLWTFGFLAIATGFHIWAEQTPIFHKHPILLVLIGMAVLFITGSLYKELKKNHE